MATAELTDECVRCLAGGWVGGWVGEWVGGWGVGGESKNDWFAELCLAFFVQNAQLD